ncbi:hypothetical protein AVEN_18809-1 [Araneus ventricosus]|uniref:Uncharacterized protein n=1 Tax=Araneus ventricosus TaxID=182803 RepID=A0A4Y2PVA4_ARAVE|nr:hypothetical protein AVEN_18809-1 [Araneus ventricosus]
MVSAAASEPVDREFYPGLGSYSVFAIICNEFAVASLLQLRPMVTSKLALTCCKLVSHLHSCRVKLAASLQICSASLLQTKIAIWGMPNNDKPNNIYAFIIIIQLHQLPPPLLRTFGRSQDRQRRCVDCQTSFEKARHFTAVSLQAEIVHSMEPKNRV